MKKRKLLVCVMSLVLLVGVIVSAMTMSASAARGTGGTINTNTDWKETGLNLVQGKDYAYSFAVIGDTQNLNLYHDVRKGTSYLKGMYQWILDNQTSKNIQYVMGVGDITQSWNRDYGNEMYAEWINAAEALALLDGKIDYSLVRGNHDFSDSIDGFNGVFGIGDKTANGVDNQYYENLLALSAINDAEGRPMAGFRIDGKIEETYRKVTMGNDKYIIITLDWHPTSKETDCVTDAKNLCTDEEYCVVHYNTTSKTCANDSANCVKYTGCNHHNSYVNGKTFCSYELCTDSCTKHDTLGWLDKLLTDNADYTAIITMHSFIMRDGSTVDDIEDVFPYENSNGTRDVRWHEVSSTGGNVTPKQLWENVLYNHANVKMLFCGHVDEDNIITTQLRGKNGNTVTCQLIDGQTIDSKQEPVGLVAMYYMSADGTVVNVEYISTVRAAEGKPAYLRDVNQFTLTLDYGDAWTATEYGYIPTEIYNEHVFHVMLDDDSDPNTVNTLYGSYDTWEEALTAVNELKGISAAAARKAKTYNIVMSKDYTYTNEVTSSQLDHNQCCENPSKIALDLNGKTFSLANGTTFLPMYNTKSSHQASFTVKNGTMVFNGSAQGIVTQHGHPTNAKGSVIDVNLIDLHVKYASGAKGDFVHPFNMSDASGTRSTVNLNVTNCNIDASEAGTVTIFNLSDKHNDNDVKLTIKGGSIKGGTVANTTFVKQNYPGDSVTFIPDANGNYTTFTYGDNAQLSGVFNSETEGKYLEFAAPTEKDGVYASALVSSSAIVTKYGPIPTKYQDTTKYPFLLFKNGAVIHASNSWKTLIDTDIKGNKEYQSGCVLLLQRDYSTSEATAAPSYFAYIDDIIFDLNGYTITRGSYHFIQLFGTEATAHKTTITLMNGTVKSTTNTAPIVYNNNSNNTSGDVMNMVFNGVTFDFSSVTSGDQGVLVAFGDGSSKGIDSTMTFNDCTFYRGASTRKTTLFDLIDYKANTSTATYTVNKTDVKVIVNGGKLVADTLSDLTFAEYSPERETGKGSPDTVTLGKGTDGKELQVVVPNTADVSSVKFGLTVGNHVLVKNADSGSNTSYVLRNVTTAYGDIPAEYLDETQYPFLLFKNGSLVHAASDWLTLINTDIYGNEAFKSGCTLLLRRSYSTTEDTGSASYFYIIKDMTIDLNGYTLTRGDKHLFQLIGYGASYTSSITIKNGTIKSGGSLAPICFNNNKNNSGIDSFNVTCENVTFDVSYNSTGIVTCFKDGTVGSTNTIIFKNCTISRGSSTSTQTLFSLVETAKETGGVPENKVDVNIVLDGGTFTATSLKGLTFATFSAERESGAGSPDKVTFKNSFTVRVPKDYEVPETTFAFAQDEYDFTKTSEDSSYAYYTFVSKSVEPDEPEEEPAKDFVIEGYGEVPAAYADKEAYPFLIFYNGKFVEGYLTMTKVLEKTKALVDTASEREVCDTVYVVMRRNVDSVSESLNAMTLLGKMVVDLQGYVLRNASASTKSIINSFINYNGINSSNVAEHLSNPAEITFKNGTLRNEGSYHMFGFDMTDGSVLAQAFKEQGYKGKEITYNFENVEFQAVNKEIMRNWNKKGEGISVNVNVKDCTFNFTGMKKDLAMFNCTGTDIVYDLKITGNTNVIASDLNNNKLYNVAANDTVSISGNVTLTQTTSTTPSFVYEAGAKCTFVPVSSADGKYVYKLGVKTAYGVIDLDYASDTEYPFVVFKADGTFVEGYKTFAEATAAAGLIAGGSGSKVGGTDAVILFRADYNHTTGVGHVTKYYNNVTIDLGGHNVTMTTSFLGCYFDGTLTGDATFGKITIKNGSIIGDYTSTSYSIIRMDNAKGAVAISYDVDFINVKLVSKNAPYFAVSTASNATGTVNVKFVDCVFDFTESTSKSYISASGNKGKINATIVGGTILAGDKNGIAFVDTTNSTQGMAYYPATTNDTIVFVKDANGDYVKLVLDNGVAAPTATYTVDGVDCVFVKASANDTATTYKLYPKVMVDYKIKTSVTLWSNFVYNIYIPVANVNGFTVNGKTMEYITETIDGVEYYVIKVNLPAGETLKDIALTVTLNSGNTTVDANWTLNVYNYTKAVLGGNYDDTTKTLMKDMLVYAAAAHTYFENTEAVAAKLSEIKTLLGDYAAEMPTGEAKAPADKTYFTDVAVYLGEVPSFRFYLAEGYTAADFSFKVGNRTVEAKASEDGKYVEIVMYAYMMLDDVTFTVKSNGATGTYNLYSYYEYAKTLNNANLTAVVEALMKYSVSANNYRTSVVNK